MFERASSLVCSRSTSLRRLVTCDERVPAAKRAMNSLSCAIFLSRCAFCDFERRADLRLGHHHVVIAARVDDDRLVIDIGGVRGHGIQKMPVVRNGNQRAVVILQKILQPVDRIKIEIVCRLVQQQRFWLAKQRLRQQHAHFLAALQL